MGNLLSSRRFALFLYFAKGVREEPPIVEAFPLFLKFLDGFFPQPLIFEAFPSFLTSSRGP